MSELKPPDDSLRSYFDELLGGDLNNDSQISLPLVVGDNFTTNTLSNSATNVVNLNSRNKNTALMGEKKSLLARETPKPLKPLPEYAEPIASSQDQEKKQKLEKLLQTAQQQFLQQEQSLKQEQLVVEEKRLVEEQKVEPEIQTLNKTFVQIPEEIQDWPIETSIIDASIIETAIDTPVETVIEAVTLIETTSEIEIAAEIKQEILHDIIDEKPHYSIPNLEWGANGLPQWAQEKFDVLLFDVAGLTLAVPLISLGQIYPLTDELTPLFGQASWFMGLQPTPMGKIRTVNTAQFVMPEKYNDSFLKSAKYVMSLDGVPWGLALDSVNQPMRLDPDQVKWRSDRSKRPWLAGTVKAHMCALLDVPRIAQLLLDMDKNHQPR